MNAPINSPFRMPVEFAVAAYRFGHSMVRDRYWLSFDFTDRDDGAGVPVHVAIRNLPVFSNWVVDFNAFFETGIPVPIFNKARPIDSVLTQRTGIAARHVSGMMAVLAHAQSAARSGARPAERPGHGQAASASRR